MSEASERLWRAVHGAFDPIRPVVDPALRAERQARYNPMLELDGHLLLAYPNESTWYLPHPVLTLKLLRG